MKNIFRSIKMWFINEVKLKLYRIVFVEDQNERGKLTTWEYRFNNKLVISLKTNFPDTHKKFDFINTYRDKAQQVQTDYLNNRYQRLGNIIQDLYKLFKLKLK